MSYLLSNQEVIVHTLNNLGNEYKELIFFKELCDKLLNHETYLKQEEKNDNTYNHNLVPQKNLKEKKTKSMKTIRTSRCIMNMWVTHIVIIHHFTIKLLIIVTISIQKITSTTIITNNY